MPKRLTIKEISKKIGVSEFAIKDNLQRLLAIIPMKERVTIMEHMLYSKEHRHEKEAIQTKVIELDKLPIDPDATRGQEFLGVTDDELWGACKEYERRMKATTDPHAEFGLKRELIVEVAKEVSARNLIWIGGHLDKERPAELLKQLHKAPQDKPTWALRLLRRHGFKQVELVVWVAANVFLDKWVEKFGRDALGAVVSRMPHSKI